MNSNEKKGLAFFIATVVIGCLLVVNHLVVYERTDYPIDIARSHLALALETHSVEGKTNYMLQVHNQYLDGFTGNSEWWYPTERTDIDVTKNLLRNVAEDVLDQNNVKHESGKTYLQLPHNELMVYLDNQINEVDDKLRGYGHSAYWNPANNLLWYILMPIMLVCIFVTPMYAFTEPKNY